MRRFLNFLAQRFNVETAAFVVIAIVIALMIAVGTIGAVVLKP